MDNVQPGKLENNHHGFLSGGGELGNLIRSFDWCQTCLGCVESWPQSLRSALSICLNSNFPIAIYWGKDLNLLYNDAWSPIPGDKHPGALGLGAKVVWPEIWADLAPQFEKAFNGIPGGSKDALLPMQRRGYTEECYFDFTFTPIYGEEGTVEGVFNAVIETTYQVIHERRTLVLKNLAIQLAGSSGSNELYRHAIDLIKDFTKDIPFAFLYTVDSTGTTHFQASTHADIVKSDLWHHQLPVNDLISSGESIHISNLNDYFPDVPYGFWPEQPFEGLLLPLKDNKGCVNGYLFCGLSARLGYDQEYKIFVESIGSTISTVAQNIFSLELERKRSSELLELDRAKTAFFTNISHEFRTPLTLLIGPVEQFLSDPALTESARVQIEPVYRNALRMQKLVNTLLEFSRIEAGRVEAKYMKVDIVALTTDLASTFRSAIENAGMELRVGSSQITAEVFVDPQMWEKIILNLVSNAFKYSFEGLISIQVEQVGENIQVSVSDTGIGIASEHLEKLFDRFHRIEDSAGRSQEGTGIGLALVKELVALHKGSIRVESQPGKGSIFTVIIPTGHQHLPANMLFDEPVDGITQTYNAYRQEALGWTQRRNSPTEDLNDFYVNPTAPATIGATAKRHKVLVADDNADIREYIKRLLSEKFVVVTAADGEDAFTKMLLHKPDILISDIMMPGLDGFGLLKKIRVHPELKATPVIFLSARAGEEAKVEGLDQGADDYLVKPFSAKELMVRVSNHIRISQIRRETEQQFYRLFLQAPALINVFKGPDHVYELFHPKNKEIFGDVDFTGLSLADALPELESQGIIDMLDHVYHKGETIIQNQMPVTFLNKDKKNEKHYFNLTYQPWYDIRGNIQGVLNFATDVTSQVEAQQVIEKSERNLRNIISQAPVPMCIFRGERFVVETANKRMLELWGKSMEQVTGKPVLDGIPEIAGQGFDQLLGHVYSSGERYSAFERPVALQRNGRLEQVHVNFVYEALREDDGSISGVMAIAVEVTEQVLARRKIEDAEEKARLAIESADLGTYEVNLLTNEIITSQRFNEIWGIAHAATRTELASHLHPDDQAIREQAHLHSMSTGQLEYEARVLWDEGSIHWIKVKGRVIYDSQGTATGLLGVIQDITKQKHFAQQLHVQVNERTQQLQRSNADLQQFAHVASHDLREPVRKIKLYSSRLQGEYGQSLPEKGSIFVDKILQAADRMYSMIEGVLAYSSFNAIEQKNELIDLNEVIDSIESDMEILIAQKNAVIKKEMLPLIEGAPVLIYQLFYNLVNNALKFSKTGESATVSIYCRNADADDLVTIVVEDNGIGFEQQYGQRIFETFTRLNRKDDYEGTGLGLSLCKKIVERHNGKIQVESELNSGAKFMITLPIKQKS